VVAVDALDLGPTRHPIGYRWAVRAAALLVEARRRSHLSRRELARRAGTSAATLAAYEQGEKEPGVATLERLLAAAGFDLEARLAPRLGRDEEARIAADLEDVLLLAEALPSRPRGELGYPPLHRALR
jgi:transcriptional regulator with XRE-family HTH domain